MNVYLRPYLRAFFSRKRRPMMSPTSHRIAPATRTIPATPRINSMFYTVTGGGTR